MFTVNPPLGGMSQNSGVHSESGGKVAGSREELLGSLFSDPSISNKHVKDLVAGRLTRQSAHDLLDVLTEIDVTTCDGPDEPGLTIRPVIAHLFRTASDKQAFRDILIDYGKSKLQEKFGSADPKELYRKSLGEKEIRQLNSFQWLCAIGLDRKGVTKSIFALQIIDQQTLGNPRGSLAKFATVNREIGGLADLYDNSVKRNRIQELRSGPKLDRQQVLELLGEKSGYATLLERIRAVDVKQAAPIINMVDDIAGGRFTPKRGEEMGPQTVKTARLLLKTLIRLTNTDSDCKNLMTRYAKARFKQNGGKIFDQSPKRSLEQMGKDAKVVDRIGETALFFALRDRTDPVVAARVKRLERLPGSLKDIRDVVTKNDSFELSKLLNDHWFKRPERRKAKEVRLHQASLRDKASQPELKPLGAPGAPSTVSPQVKIEDEKKI